MANTPDQQRVLDDIRKYGCHAIHVQATEEEPSYTYTVGIGRIWDAADLVVIGQPHPDAHRLLHHYNRLIREGQRFETGQMLSGFLKGQQCVLREVHESHKAALFEWNTWLNDGRTTFPMLQLVYPTVEGIWPWDSLANDWLRRHQPLLSQPA